MKSKKGSFENCPNCGEKLAESYSYCPSCGQENRDKNVSLRSLLMDFLSDFFTFDSKIFRSLIPLLFKPGSITKDYNAGKRARYIPPLRLFIFISIIYFFALSFSKDFEKAVDLDQAVIVTDTPDDDGINFNWSGTKKRQEGKIRIHRDSSQNENAFTMEKFKALVAAYPAEVVADSITGRKTGFTHTLFVQMAKLQQSKGKDLQSFILSNGSLAILLIVPVFALLLFLLFNTIRRTYVAHLIFSIHFHSFLLIWSLPLVAQGVFSFEFPLWIKFPYFLWLLYYLHRSLRNVYQLSRWKVVKKELILIVVYGVVFIPIFLISALTMSFLLF